MRKVWLFLFLPLFLAASVSGDIVGSDSFEYADGAIAGQNGGYGWDWQGEGNPQGTNPTSWIHYAGITDVVSEELVLQDSGDGWIATKRDFSSDTWGTGAFQNVGIVYLEWRRVENGEIDPYSAADEILQSEKLLAEWAASVTTQS